jgi:hypothetical protein
MSTFKNPFIVIPDFVSPLTCEDIVDRLTPAFPDLDETRRPQSSSSINRLSEIRLADYLDEAVEFVETHYDVSIKGVQPLQFEYYPEGCAATAPVCANSAYMTRQWSRTNNKDFVGVIFLSDYQEKVPFDPSYEVKGGKLQFPTHDFGFNPKRGMLVIFPGNEYFIHNTSEIFAGDLHQIKIYFTASENYVYQSRLFPGNYEVWFK